MNTCTLYVCCSINIFFTFTFLYLYLKVKTDWPALTVAPAQLLGLQLIDLNK